jgi:CRISPR-associated protein (TIGR03986 family)
MAELEFFLGGRDLEMVVIRQLLVQSGVSRIRDHDLSWGTRTSASRNQIDSLQCISGAVLKGAVARLLLEVTGSKSRVVGGTVPSFKKLAVHFQVIRFAEARPMPAGSQVGTCRTPRQDFVAIDRFTGGAADGAKFDACYADRPTLKSRLTLDLIGLEPPDIALLALGLRDVCEGKVTFGFGASKGYGEASGTIRTFKYSGIDSRWGVPQSLLSGRFDGDAIKWLSDNLLKQVKADAQVLAENTDTLQLADRETPIGDCGEKTTAPVAKAKTIELKEGKLDWQGEGAKRKRVLAVEGIKLPYQINSPNQIRSDLSSQTEDHISVQYILEKGQPGQIRPHGQPWELANNAGIAQAVVPAANQFANPYYFLPLADRTKNFVGELDDRAPAGHKRYLPDRFSGTIRVRLTTKTPLLICDTVCDGETVRESKGHKTFDMRLQDGKPLLAASSIRGMLRSAYEGITNSRLGVFPFNHKKPGEANLRRMGYRMSAGEGLSVIPVRIEGGKAQLMLGTNPQLPYFNGKSNRWMVPESLLHAAWIERYSTNRGPSKTAVKMNGILPEHKSTGWCWLEKIRHSNPPFYFWAVREAALREEDLSVLPPASIGNAGNYSSLNETMKIKGYFCVTNQNIRNKHDERFFFQTQSIIAPIDEKVRDQYLLLVRDYQLIHKVEIEKRLQAGNRPDDYLGSEPGKTAWSRHVYSNDSINFEDGTLCYASTTMDQGKYVINALYPVMISRKLYELSPLDLLPARLRPAKNFGDLSPADRVFGWVSQDEDSTITGEPAYRSQCRVGTVKCTSDDSITHFDPPATLAILGQPKPQQGRFYLGQQNGSVQVSGQEKQRAGYTTMNRIRGPKIYPHHQHHVESNWRGREQSDQNRSITGWVKENSTFEFDLHVTNLSEMELNALVWLLSLPDEHFLRLGLGKPLGFGSVRAEIVLENSTIASGAEWSAAIRTWNSEPKSIDLTNLPAKYEDVMSAANQNLLPSFRKAARGFGELPIHYPQLPEQQGGDGEHFEWFGKNERGRRLSLPDLHMESVSLPRNPDSA